MKNKRKKAEKILNKLKRIFPKAKTTLKYKNNWELLVAVMLSAQCTDKKVNEVTKKLFKKYKNINDYIRAKPNEFEKDIFQTGFYKNKTKNILEAAKKIKQKFGGKIPKTMREMLEIPGVGRKTANVVLGNAYGIVEGIAVDTHVLRLSKVLGLSKNSNPEAVEKDLMKLLPKKDWLKITYLLIEYGRKYCVAKKHNHKKCPLYKA